MLTRITTIAAEKGGVGKTTTTYNLGAGTTRRLRSIGAPNARVLLIDADVQRHLTDLALKRRDYDKSNSLYTVLMAERNAAPIALMDCIVQAPDDPDLFVLPASSALYEAMNVLMGVPGAPFRLADALNPVRDHFATVFIDTGPSFGLLTEMAVLASTDVLIPTEARYLETLGLHNAINNVHRIRDGWRHEVLRIVGVVITQMDRRITGHAEMIEVIRTHPELGPLMLGVIPQNEAVSYSHHAQQSLFDYDPKCAAAVAYEELIEHVMPLLMGGD